MKTPNYHATVLACYAGNITQAIVVNMTPVLFIPIKDQLGLSYSHLGLLVLINFITQVSCDILFSKAVERHGFRPFVVTAHFLCAVGFVLYGLTPWLFKGMEFAGLVIATIIFSCSGGLLELLLSPIVDAIPTDEKGKAMAMLHSFYAWGQVAVVLLTTGFLAVFGRQSWPFIAFLWALLPLINAFAFMKVPLANRHADGVIPMSIRKLLKNPIFIIAFFAILFGGASEVTMAQWASTFMERGLVLPKLAGDLLGPCGFAVTLGIGRMIYGLFGDKINIHRVMIWGCVGAAACYLLVAFAPIPAVAIAGCILSGLCVSLLWPCTLVVASAKLPLAGASMFALLAAGGDIGASVGPWLTGLVADAAPQWPVVGALFGNLNADQLGLRAGILLAIVLPILGWVSQMALKRVKSEDTADTIKT